MVLDDEMVSVVAWVRALSASASKGPATLLTMVESEGAWKGESRPGTWCKALLRSAGATLATASVGLMWTWLRTLLASSVSTGARLAMALAGLMLAWLRALLASVEKAGARLAMM